MSADLDDVECPICGDEGGECGHLLARLALDGDSEIDAGAVLDGEHDLLDQLRTITEEALRTGEPVFLGDAFAGVLDVARNAIEEEDVTTSDERSEVVDNLLPQLSQALCEQLVDRDGVERVEDAEQLTVWTEDPESVIGQLAGEYEAIIEELEGLGDAEGDDDYDDDEDEDDDEEDEDEEEE